MTHSLCGNLKLIISYHVHTMCNIFVLGSNIIYAYLCTGNAFRLASYATCLGYHFLKILQELVV